MYICKEVKGLGSRDFPPEDEKSNEEEHGNLSHSWDNILVHRDKVFSMVGCHNGVICSGTLIIRGRVVLCRV